MTSSLTHTQQMIWAGQKRCPNEPLYNMALAFHILDILDVNRFQLASEHLASKCETFRTIFTDRNGSVQRRIIESTKPLEIVNLTDVDQPEMKANAWLSDRAKRPFKLDECLTDQALLLLSPQHSIWYLNQHHLITDASTAEILFRTLEQLYKETDVRPLPSFADKSADRITESSQQYWEDLADSVAVPSPILYGRSLTVDSVQSKRQVQTLGRHKTKRLYELALSSDFRGLTQGLSKFQMLAAIVFAFLYRQTGERHLSIATTIHGRSSPIDVCTPGVFTSIFPLEIELIENPKFTDILKAVRTAAIGFFTHAQNAVSRPDLLSRSPILLNVLQSSFGPFAGMKTRTEWLDSGAVDRQHALRVAVFDFNQTDDLNFLFDFNEAAFGDRECQWFQQQLMRFIDQILGDPSIDIASTQLLSNEELQTALYSAKSIHRQLPTGATLPSLFTAQLHKFSEHLAVSGPSVCSPTTLTLTYNTLERRANQLANYLTEVGVNRGDHVALLLEPSVEFIVGILAIVKCGAAYLSLSVDDPNERIVDILDDVSASVLITQKTHQSCRPVNTRCIFVDSDADAISKTSDTAPNTSIDSEEVCYLICTSGSTGKPKAVRARHISLINLLDAFEHGRELPDGTRVSWWTSPTFDVSLYEIWSALLYGRSLYILPHAVRPDTSKVLTLLKAESIHSAFLPAFMLNELASGMTTLPNLRRLLVGVEPISEAMVLDVLHHNPALRIINGYGPAEATICTTLFEVERSVGIQDEKKAIPIGRPIQNSTLHLLDVFCQPVVPGAPGEVYVGGTGLAKGYWNRPQLNSKLFLCNSTLGASSTRLYRTGDRARYQSDGNLQFLGRIDDQLKIRGHRIEPGEIVTALQRHPDVHEVVIRPWPKINSQQIIAYVSSTTTSAERLREHARSLLPQAMQPGSYVFLDALPKNSSGKIEVDALPDPIRATDRHVGESPLEERLVTIWQEILHKDNVGVEENFFDLGGDSISALRIVGTAQSYGIHLHHAQLFEHQTIQSLARWISDTVKPTPSVQRCTGEVPLTPIQRWFFDQHFRHPGIFNQQITVSLSSGIERITLQSRLNEILANHDAFRLAFDGDQQYLIDDDPFLTLDEYPDIINAEVALNRAFALDQAPLIRAAIIDRTNLILVAHHLIIDGVSWWSLFSQLERFTESYGMGFAQWSQSVTENLQRGVYDNELGFWRTKTKYPTGSLPMDFPTAEPNAATEATTRRQSLSLSIENTLSLKQTMQPAILTALAVAIGEWASLAGLTIDVEGHGRESALADGDVVRSVGWFTSIYPVHIGLDQTRSPVENFEHLVSDMAAIPRKGSAFGALAFLCANGKLNDEPADVLFNYVGDTEWQCSDDGLIVDVSPITLVRHQDNVRSHLLEIDAAIYQEQLTINWHYSVTQFDRKTISRLLARTITVLEEIADFSRQESPQHNFGLSKSELEKLSTLLNKTL